MVAFGAVFHMMEFLTQFFPGDLFVPGFLAMGGYGPYVWSAYGAALTVLAVSAVAPRFCRRRVERLVAREAAWARRPSGGVVSPLKGEERS